MQVVFWPWVWPPFKSGGRWRCYGGGSHKGTVVSAVGYEKALKKENRVPPLKTLFLYSKTGAKIVDPYGELSYF